MRYVRANTLGACVVIRRSVLQACCYLFGRPTQGKVLLHKPQGAPIQSHFVAGALFSVLPPVCATMRFLRSMASTATVTLHFFTNRRDTTSQYICDTCVRISCFEHHFDTEPLLIEEVLLCVHHIRLLYRILVFKSGGAGGSMAVLMAVFCSVSNISSV